MKQGEIAERLGYSAQKLSTWENDTRSIDFADLVAYAEVTGVSVEWLLGESEKDVNAHLTVDEVAHLLTVTGLDLVEFLNQFPLAGVDPAVIRKSRGS